VINTYNMLITIIKSQTPRLSRHLKIPGSSPPLLQLGPLFLPRIQTHSSNRQRRLWNPSPPPTTKDGPPHRPLHPKPHLDSRLLRRGTTNRTIHPHPSLNTIQLQKLPRNLPNLPQNARKRILEKFQAMVQRKSREQRSKKYVYKFNDPENRRG